MIFSHQLVYFLAASQFASASIITSERNNAADVTNSAIATHAHIRGAKSNVGRNSKINSNLSSSNKDRHLLFGNSVGSPNRNFNVGTSGSAINQFSGNNNFAADTLGDASRANSNGMLFDGPLGGQQAEFTTLRDRLEGQQGDDLGDNDNDGADDGNTDTGDDLGDNENDGVDDGEDDGGDNEGDADTDTDNDGQDDEDTDTGDDAGDEVTDTDVDGEDDEDTDTADDGMDGVRPRVTAQTRNGDSPVCNQVLGLSNGYTMSLTLDLSADLSVTPLPFGNIVLTENATGTNAFMHVTYVVDRSISTASPCDDTRSILQCEKDALKNVNNQLVSTGTGVSVGLVPFDSTATPADLDPATAGINILAEPRDADVNTTIDNLSQGGGSNFTAALQAAAVIVTQAQRDPRVTQSMVLLLADGNSDTSLSAEATNLQALNARVMIFLVGSSATCDENLNAFTAATGGSCRVITNAPSLDVDLANFVFPDRSLSGVSATVDNQNLAVTTTPELTVAALDPLQNPVIVFTNDFPQDNGSIRNVCLNATVQNESTGCCLEVILQVEGQPAVSFGDNAGDDRENEDDFGV